MTKETPITLREWEDYLHSALTAAQNSNLSDSDRDILLEFVQEHAPLVLYGPATPSQEPERDSVWSDIGYQERREANDEGEVPFSARLTRAGADLDAATQTCSMSG